MVSLRKPVVVIAGPTASGKTALAVDISRLIGAEVISADSMQVYRGMDIGTGKNDVDRLAVRYGIDLTSPEDRYSAALFQRYARDCIAALDEEGKRALLVGGTGLYVRAVIDDMRFPRGEQADNPLRKRYEDYAAEQGASALWQLLFEKDPKSARAIHPNNTRRVVRALEMAEENVSYAEQKENFSHICQAMPAYIIGLSVAPEILNARIDERVGKMIEAGWLDEVRALYDKGLTRAVLETGAIGYAEMVAVIEGRMTLAEAQEAIRTATRRYAKRQRTWLRRDRRTHWVNADHGITPTLIEEVLTIIAECDNNSTGACGENGDSPWTAAASVV